MEAETAIAPLARALEAGLIAAAVGLLVLAGRIFLSRAAWEEGAQYEMLDLPPPRRRERVRAAPGRLGLEDRIVRFGIGLALAYITVTWFGSGSLAMWVGIPVAVYLLGTCAAGRDPIYRAAGWSSRFE